MFRKYWHPQIPWKYSLKIDFLVQFFALRFFGKNKFCSIITKEIEYVILFENKCGNERFEWIVRSMRLNGQEALC